MPLLASCLAYLLLPSNGLTNVRDIVAKNQPARDVWVFRSVLDKHARIATMAIAPGYWLSYDATNCGLYKFWNGDLKFDGAVYTTVHGPQPTSEGGALEEGSTNDKVWTIKVNGEPVTVKPRYRGHYIDVLDRSLVHFQYDFAVKSKVLRVNETPQLLWESGKPVGLRRQFSVGNYVNGQFQGQALDGATIQVALGKTNGLLKNFKSMGGKRTQKLPRA